MSRQNHQWPDGIHLSFDFPGGTCCRVERVDDKRFRCRPYASRSGCQWFYFCVRAENLPAGEQITLELNWPAILKPEDLPTADRETIQRETEYDSFAKVLPHTCLLSDDMRTFRPAAGVELTDDRTVTVPVTGTGGDVHLATQMPYTSEHHAALLADADRTEPGCVKPIGSSQAVLPVAAVLLESDAGPDAPTVYVQAYQHITEFSGPLVVDSMVRHLLAGAPGRELRKNLAFHFVPAVDVDAVFYGPALLLAPATVRDLRSKNPNRDWKDRTWPEVRAAQDLLRQQADSGRRYVAGLDLHNGWHMAHDSGGAYTIGEEESDGARAVERQKEFVDHMYARTDHEHPGNYWEHSTGGRSFKAFFMDLAGTPLAHTVEFSRHMWWNREKREYEPYRPHHPQQFARQAAEALVEFFA